MFDADYSHGKIRIHPCVPEQIDRWVNAKNRKVTKFGEAMLKDISAKAAQYSSGIKEPTSEQLTRSKRILTNIEDQLDQNDIGAAADHVDQLLLTLAYVNKAYLATQERTMTMVGQKSLPSGVVIRFEDMVLDLISLKKLTKDEVDTGLHSVDHYGERLDSSKRAAIAKAAKS
ncbi:MAG: hypothetical protein IPK68_09930 [Bdellovibrionales bacterium]|nr:hypothetical protein [Bdellovibrionales bacterium]